MEEKKEIKIRLSTVIYLIIIIALVVALGVMYYFGFVVNKNENIDTENIANLNNNEISNTDLVEKENKVDEDKASKYVWEKYSSDIKKKIALKMFGEGDYNVDEIISQYIPNTIYSLINKYPEKEFENCPFRDYFNDVIISGGDSTEILEFHSNYSQYNYYNSEKEIELKKYIEPITYKIAMLNELYDPACSISVNDKEPTLEERLASQYADLKSGKKDYHYDNIPEDRKFYYEIPAMLVMNGNNTSEKDYKNNSRAKKLKVTINEDKEYIFELEDTNAVQVFDIDYKQNTIEKPVSIEIEVLERYIGEEAEDIYISDIQFSIDSNIPQGR